MKITQAELNFYQEQGYIILRRAFGQQRIEALIGAVERLLDRALEGGVELGWIDRDKRLPERTSHLLHPNKYDAAFGEWLEENLAPQLEALVDSGTVRHSLFGMLASGGGKPYCQSWHRDLSKPGTSTEVQFLQRFSGQSVQFNAPLVAGDRFLNIVPGSHLRASTEVEIRAAQANSIDPMPNALVVELEPGDVVYYNANLWHRGWNPTGEKRWTLHCAFWGADYPVMAHEHGQREALLAAGHLEQMPTVVRLYIERYLQRYPAGEPLSVFEI